MGATDTLNCNTSRSYRPAASAMCCSALAAPQPCLSIPAAVPRAQGIATDIHSHRLCCRASREAKVTHWRQGSPQYYFCRRRAGRRSYQEERW